MDNSPLTYNKNCDTLPMDSLCQDHELVLSRCEENMLKRLRQLGQGFFQLVVMDGKPKLLIIGGKVEILG